ncbi:hypothetical protein [Arundinibacter roseus]|uniref:Uncharacterized protein n=1 Tax=Arundinibacter roseus TaxID=2070510 RepID=A0A4R4KD24_9BACT|nr:hypothetical protein [Arundinibacter roseus]TDB64371.1 hypothetical protein EZE20_11855 [Arundinibacter roseus]
MKKQNEKFEMDLPAEDESLQKYIAFFEDFNGGGKTTEEQFYYLFAHNFSITKAEARSVIDWLIQYEILEHRLDNSFRYTTLGERIKVDGWVTIKSEITRRQNEKKAKSLLESQAIEAEFRSKKLWWINPLISALAVFVSIIALWQTSANSNSQKNVEIRIDSLKQVVSQQKLALDSLSKFQNQLLTPPKAPPPKAPAGADQSAAPR